ncbi:unnamed protein product [Cyprideis torosa]|uniref:Uncharacterized protein n=1 Tax=Cyprideis torosa TaxID=163714 RepID=A0A7R8WBJ4_9CRUS|nr:unnamed protein product [Cyprideis torosa]CAG0886361.1 unnamed protein product [Cyprideis torosa]
MTGRKRTKDMVRFANPSSEPSLAELKTPKAEPCNFQVGEEVLSRGKDGINYLGTILQVDEASGRCYVAFEDSSNTWSLFKDVKRLSDWSCSPQGACLICGAGPEADEGEVLVGCDQCGERFHPDCHKPAIPIPVPTDPPWSCSSCLHSRLKISPDVIQRQPPPPLKSKETEGVPHDFSWLHWDRLHRENREQIYCYCGGPGEWFSKMLQCLRCLQWFHEACVESLPHPLLLGDRFYVFVCYHCNHSQGEYLQRLPLTWVDTAHLVLFNLTVIHRKEFFDLDKRILPFLHDNWTALQLPEQMTRLPQSEREKPVFNALLKSPLRFINGKDKKRSSSCWALRSRSPPAPPKAYTAHLLSGPLLKGQSPFKTDPFATEDSALPRKRSRAASEGEEESSSYEELSDESNNEESDDDDDFEEVETSRRRRGGRRGPPRSSKPSRPKRRAVEEQGKRLEGIRRTSLRVGAEREMVTPVVVLKRGLEEELPEHKSSPPKKNPSSPSSPKKRDPRRDAALKLLNSALRKGSHKTQRKLEDSLGTKKARLVPPSGGNGLVKVTRGTEGGKGGMEPAHAREKQPVVKTPSGGPLESFLPPPKDFEGENHPFRDSMPLFLKTKRKLSEKDIRVGKNGEIKRRYRKRRDALSALLASHLSHTMPASSTPSSGSPCAKYAVNHALSGPSSGDDSAATSKTASTAHTPACASAHSALRKRASAVPGALSRMMTSLSVASPMVPCLEQKEALRTLRSPFSASERLQEGENVRLLAVRITPSGLEEFLFDWDVGCTSKHPSGSPPLDLEL